jgi:hypothetical protein
VPTSSSDPPEESCDGLDDIQVGDTVLFSAPKSLLDNGFDDTMIHGSAVVGRKSLSKLVSDSLGSPLRYALKLTLVTDEPVNDMPVAFNWLDPYGPEDAFGDLTGRVVFWNSASSPGLRFTVALLGFCKKLPIDEKTLEMCAKLSQK